MPPNRLFFCSSVLMDAAMYNLCTNKALISFYSFFSLYMCFLFILKKILNCVICVQVKKLPPLSVLKHVVIQKFSKPEGQVACLWMLKAGWPARASKKKIDLEKARPKNRKSKDQGKTPRYFFRRFTFNCVPLCSDLCKWDLCFACTRHGQMRRKGVWGKQSLLTSIVKYCARS